MDALALWPVSAVTWASLLAIAGVVPLVLMNIATVWRGGPRKRLRMAALMLFAGLGLVSLAAVLPNRVTIEGDQLVARAGLLFRTEVPLAALRLQDIGSHVVPARPVYGVLLPGYLGGHFQNADAEPQFFVVTDDARGLLHLPVDQGPDLFLSFRDPAAAISRLQQAAAR